MTIGETHPTLFIINAFYLFFFFSYPTSYSLLWNFQSLLLLNQEKFEFMAYNIDDIDEEFLQNDYTLTVGEKALLYLYPIPRLFDNFW